MKSVIFSNLPMPPQANNCYPGTFRRFSSPELKQYKRTMGEWRLEHLQMVNLAKRELRSRLQKFIRVDRYFIFKPSRIFSLKHEPKKLDASNRVKCLDDALAEILQIDDKYFSSGIAEKVIGLESDADRVLVVLTTVDLRREQDLVRFGRQGIPQAIGAAHRMEESWAQ